MTRWCGAAMYAEVANVFPMKPTMRRGAETAVTCIRSVATEARWG